jgi:hypothetical protein
MRLRRRFAVDGVYVSAWEYSRCTRHTVSVCYIGELVVHLRRRFAVDGVYSSLGVFSLYRARRQTLLIKMA